MSLRQRLLLVLIGSGLGMVGVLALARDLLARAAAERELRSAMETRVDAIGRERCEEGLLPRPGSRSFGSAPLRPGGRRRGVEVFFFGRDFAPLLPDAPPFPEDTRERLARGETFVVVDSRARGRGGLEGVLTTGWDSERCAYAVAALPQPAALLPPAFLIGGALLALGVVAGALYLAAGSPVRRIRALAQDVGRAAARRYEGGVRTEGSDEIAQLADAFNAAAATVRSQFKAVETRESVLREFVAHTTHDVGVPLSVLAGALAEIRDAAARGESTDAPLATANREAHYIASLLHNLGAVARLETEDALHDRHPVDLGALVDRVILRHASLAREGGVELNQGLPEGTVDVSGDVTLLEQAVNNLVENAVRYNHPGGHVAVVLDVVAGRFVLRVTDDGPGVKPEDMARLGEARFRGGDARSRRPEGTGLGLSIVRDVAVRHGFDLVFRQPEGGGLEAVLSGPVAPSSQAR